MRAVALNFRSCARDLPRPRPLHPEPDARVSTTRGRRPTSTTSCRSLVSAEPGVPHAAIGISLGGNVLLKWLGENPGQTHLAAAATISVPYDLEAGARKLERGLGPVYTATFLRGLRKKARQLLRRHPEAASRFDVARMRSARTFFEFDDAVTGPLHGFRGAKHYYDTSSSLNWVARITTPTLCLSAEDDPFLPSTVLDRRGRERLGRGPPRGDAARRAHRLHRRHEPAAGPLLGRGARGGVRRRPAREA